MATAIVQSFLDLEEEEEREAMYLTMLIGEEEDAEEGLDGVEATEEDEGPPEQQQRRRRPPKKRTVWVQDWYLDRPTHGHFRFMMHRLRITDVKAFKNFTRMSPRFFLYLLDRLRHRIEKKDTSYRKAICAGTRLAITLRFYAEGESFRSLRYNWLVAGNTISKIVHQVTQAIIDEFGDKLLPPTNPEGWKSVAKRFSSRWNFHHCLGAIDGKHVALHKPHKSGSLYYNYKRFFSIVMLAIVDADYKFLWVDVGSNGGAADSQIWNSCDLKDLVERKKMGLPPPEVLPDDPDQVPVPYFFVGDDAFALKEYLMKPYSRRNLPKAEAIFNYRLSRARRIVENAFGILAHRFRCILYPMRVTPQNASNIVLACCILHNMLRDDKAPIAPGLVDEEDDQHNLLPGSFRADYSLTDAVARSAPNSGSRDVKEIRDHLRDYYNSDVGKVPWQEDALHYWKRN
jgi:hypothetical protein